MAQPRTERRWRKRAAIAVGIFVFFAVLFAIIEHWRGNWMLTRRIAQLKMAGEELSVATFLPKPVEPGQNAFAILATLTNRTDSILTNASLGPPSMRFVESGKARVTSKLTEWDSSEEATNGWNRLTAQLSDARELLSDLHTAASRVGFDSGFDYTKGFLHFQMGPLHTAKQAARVLSVATINELHRGNTTAAHSNLCALVSLIVMQKPEPLVINQLVRFACATFAFNTTWQVLHSRDLTEKQLAEAQAIWERGHFAEDMGRALEMERAMAITYGDQLRSSRENLEFALNQQEGVNEVFGDLLGSLPARGFVLHRLYAPFWRFAWSAQDQLRSLNRWQFMIERERFARANSWAKLAGKENADEEIDVTLSGGGNVKANIYDRLRYLFSNGTFSITDVIIRKELEAQTLQRLAVAAFAVERHRKTSGTLPGDLGALATRYLPTVPLDPMDGRPLRYQKTSENGFLLYSVGTDGKDDGGDPSPAISNKPYRQIWDGKDAVWPIAFDARLPLREGEP
jgi:hypothetical protein